MDKMLQHIQVLESRNPKDFWKVVNKLRSYKRDNNAITPNIWLNYYKDLYTSADKNGFDKE